MDSRSANSADLLPGNEANTLAVAANLRRRAGISDGTRDSIVQRFGNLEPQSQTQLASRHFDEFPEKVLLAFVTGEVREWLARVDQAGDAKESDKYLMLAAANLVDRIAHASTLPP
jgi:hypothetical protein